MYSVLSSGVQRASSTFCNEFKTDFPIRIQTLTFVIAAIVVIGLVVARCQGHLIPIDFSRAGHFIVFGSVIGLTVLGLFNACFIGQHVCNKMPPTPPISEDFQQSTEDT